MHHFTQRSVASFTKSHFQSHWSYEITPAKAGDCSQLSHALLSQDVRPSRLTRIHFMLLSTSMMRQLHFEHAHTHVHTHTHTHTYTHTQTHTDIHTLTHRRVPEAAL